MSSTEAHKRDEMIVNFQSCTGIEDISEAVRLLEEANWNIEIALKKVLPEEETHNFQPMSNCQNSKMRNGIPLPIIERVGELPSTSDQAQRLHLIEVYVHYNGNNDVVDLRVPDSTKLVGLKEIIYSETGYSTTLQILSGWSSEPENDNVTLAELGVASKIHLFMIAKPEPSTAYNIIHIDDDEDEEFPNQDSMPDPPEADITMYARRLKIIDEINNKAYLLILDLDTPVGTVKEYTTFITDIAVANQVWTGWPARPNIDDDTWIGILPLSLPWHNLKVRSNNETPNVAPSTMCIDLTGDTDSSPEDFEDASESFNAEDEIYIDDSVATRTEPLIPNNVEDETAGAVHFIDGFTLRYGQTSPDFLPCSLEEAIKESCMKPAKERRMLAIYLHHDGSVLSNVFCAELLCSETVLQTFGNYFLLWGWDLTNEANKNMFLASAMKNLGATVAETVRNMTTEQLPALLIVTRSRSNTELFNVIYGNIGLNDFYATLIHAVDMYSELQESEIKEEEERAARQQIKTEQDHAFQQSLLMDRAKDEAKKQKLMLESQEELRKKQEKEAEEKLRLEEQNAVLAQLPAEPEEDAKDVVKIKFRTPTGDTFARRFLAQDKLETVFNFLLVEGFRIKEYKIITSWPRRDISSTIGATTLKDLNIHSQETLIIEER